MSSVSQVIGMLSVSRQ